SSSVPHAAHLLSFPTRRSSDLPVIFHGFNRKKSIGEALLKHDFYLSFGKSVLHDVNLQQFVKDFPLEKTFLETDSADFDLEMLRSEEHTSELQSRFDLVCSLLL